MKEVFDIRRFGKYLAYDLWNAKNSALLSLVITGLMPIIFYVVCLLCNWIFFDDGCFDFSAGRVLAFITAYFVAIIVLPIKIFGKITDRRSGSNWLMVPALTFEKFLSLVVISCIVIPVCLVLLLLASDGLLTLVLADKYGPWLFPFVRDMVLDFASLSDVISFNSPAMLAMSWCSSILSFTLGSICFKKAKAGKTILCLFALSIIFSTLLTVTGVISFGGVGRELSSQTLKNSITVGNISSWLVLVLLLSGIYYRLRTIKH